MSPRWSSLRAPLGERGSYLPTAVNVVQCLGWTVFELLVIATAAAALSDELLGFEARWAWTLVFGAAALALGLLGPIGVVRTVIRRVAVWVVPLAVAYLAWWALTGGGLEDAWSRPGEGGLSTWQGIDIVVGVTVSWIPLAADYTRFARTRRGAFWGTGVGYFVPDALLLALGAVVLLTRDVADPAALPAAVAAGGLVALLALLALTVAETDEAFANAYSGAVSLQNLFPRASQPPARRADDDARHRRGARARADELPVLPLPARLVLRPPLRRAARRLACGRTAIRAGTTCSAPCRSAAGPIVAWFAGFAAYQWLSPTGPAWWVEQVERLEPPAWGIGATLPSFAAVVRACARARRCDAVACDPIPCAREQDRSRREPRRRPRRRWPATTGRGRVLGARGPRRTSAPMRSS